MWSTIETQLPNQNDHLGTSARYLTDILPFSILCLFHQNISPLFCFLHQDIEAKKEAQKEKEIDEQEANASTMQRCRTLLDKDLINTGIYESASKQSLPLVQLVQQLLRYCSPVFVLTPHLLLY